MRNIEGISRSATATLIEQDAIRNIFFALVILRSPLKVTCRRGDRGSSNRSVRPNAGNAKRNADLGGSGCTSTSACANDQVANNSTHPENSTNTSNMVSISFDVFQGTNVCRFSDSCQPSPGAQRQLRSPETAPGAARLASNNEHTRLALEVHRLQTLAVPSLVEAPQVARISSAGRPQADRMQGRVPAGSDATPHALHPQEVSILSHSG